MVFGCGFRFKLRENFSNQNHRQIHINKIAISLPRYYLQPFPCVHTLRPPFPEKRDNREQRGWDRASWIEIHKTYKIQMQSKLNSLFAI